MTDEPEEKRPLYILAKKLESTATIIANGANSIDILAQRIDEHFIFPSMKERRKVLQQDICALTKALIALEEVDGEFEKMQKMENLETADKSIMLPE